MSVRARCRLRPVGTATLGAGLAGQLDLTGELFDGVNPNAALGPFRRMRAGPFLGNPGEGTHFVEVTYHASSVPMTRSDWTGFHCARTP
jgi:hypothetical protein